MKRLAFGLATMALGLAWIAGSCSAFDDLTIPADAGKGGSTSASMTTSTTGSTRESSGSGGKSGSGGGLIGGDQAQPGYMSVEEATKLCSMAALNSDLAATIYMSLGLPVATLSSGGKPLVNTSVCVTWLAGSLPKTRVGIAEQQQVLQQMAAKSNPLLAAEEGAIQVITNSPLCNGGQVSRCVSGKQGGALSCNGQLDFLQHCHQELFDSNSTCESAPAGPRCVAEPCSPDAGLFRCKGNLGSYCDPITKEGSTYDCNYTGLDCNGGFCSTSSLGVQTCSSPLKTTCSTTEPNTLLACDGVIQVDFPCDEIDATCYDTRTDGTGIICLTNNGACKPTDPSVNHCKDANTLVLCVQGKVTEVDCSAMGLMGCSGASCITAM